MFKRFLSILLISLLLLPAFTVPSAYAMNQLVASGSVTQANMKISAVNGASFIDFSAANVLTNYNGCLLSVRDSAGREIIGWIGADGSGETLGSETLTGWPVGSATYDTWTITGADITSAADAGSDGIGASNKLNLSSGALCKVVYNITKTAGSYPFIRINVPSTGTLQTTTAAYTDTTDGAKSHYGTIDSATTDYLAWRANGAGVGFSATGMSSKQVLTPSATGVTIVSTKGGATQNFASKNSAFNYNDASGYTYRIYRCPAIQVASGSVTAANTQLSLVDGTAFAFFTGVDLSAYQTGKHLLAVYNSSTGALIAMGYCSATAPAGESLGGEAITSYSNALSNPFETFTSTTPPDIDSAINSSGVGRVCGPSFATAGKVYKIVSNITVNSGDIANLSLWYGNSSADYAPTGTILNPLVVGANTYYYTWITKNSLGFVAGNSINFSATLSVKQVTDPASTGVRIVSAKGGSTQNWLKKGSGAVNMAITYKIYYVGD